MSLFGGLEKLLGNTVKGDVRFAQRAVNDVNPWYHPNPQQATQKLLNSGYHFVNVGNGDQQLVPPGAGPILSPRTALNPYNTPIGVQAWPAAVRPIPLTAPNIAGPPRASIPMPNLQSSFPLPKANQGVFDWRNVYQPQPTQIQVQPFNMPNFGGPV